MANTDSPDRRLVAQVLAGERDVYESLVQRHVAAVYAVSLGLTRNPADAEDVTQEAFLKAFTSLGSLRNPSKFEGWVVTIARNAANRVLGERQRGKQESVVQPETEDPRAAAQKKDQHELLRDRIGRLDGPHREVLLLHYFAGKPTKEIADTLDLSQAAVLKRLQRAREALSQELLRDLPDVFAPTKPLSEQSKTIGKLVLAASIAPTATKTATATSLFTSPVTVVGGLAVLGVAMLVAMSGMDVKAPPTTPATASAPPPVVNEPRVLADRTPSSNGDQVVADQQDRVDADSTESDETSAPDERTEAEPRRRDSVSTRTEQVLARPVGIVFEDIGLWNVIPFISNNYDLKFRFDTRAVFAPSLQDIPGLVEGGVISNSPGRGEHKSYITDGVFESVDMRDVPLVEALTQLLEPMGLTYVVEPDFLWISTPEKIREDVDSESGKSVNPKLITALEQNTSAVFEDLHLRDVLAFISENHNINVAVDHRVVQPRPEPTTTQQRRPRYYLNNPSGQTLSQGKVAHIRMRDVPLGGALEVMLRPLELSYAPQDDYIVISSERLLDEGPVPDEFLVTAEEWSDRLDNLDALMAPHIRDRLLTEPPEELLEEAKEVDLWLIRIEQTPSGLEAAVKFSGERSSTGLRQGQMEKGLTVRRINPVLNTVTVYSTKYSREYVLEKESPDPVRDPDANVEITLKRLSVTKEVSGAQIVVGNGLPNWYRVGERFEEFELVAVHPNLGCVTIEHYPTGQQFEVCVPEDPTDEN